MEKKMMQRRGCVKLLVVALLQRIAYSTATCPNDWQTWTSTTTPEVQKCFKFASSIGTYSQVQDFCQNNGGEIVNIDSSEENDFIFDQIALMQQTSSYPGYNSFWLGADSLNTVSGYIQFVSSAYNGYDPTHWWNPGGGNGIGYWNWWPAEPAHVGAEHCVVMQGTYNKLWNDEACESFFVRSAACQLVGSGTAASTMKTTSDATTSATSMRTTTSASTKDTTTDSTTKVTARQTTIVSTAQQPATTASLQSTEKTTEPPNPPGFNFLPSLSGEFIRKGQVCLLNFGLKNVTTASINRCAGMCVRHEICVSFSYISVTEENQCMLYSVSKDFEHASLSYEPSPGLSCLYFERI